MPRLAGGLDDEAIGEADRSFVFEHRVHVEHITVGVKPVVVQVRQVLAVGHRGAQEGTDALVYSPDGGVQYLSGPQTELWLIR